MTEHVTVTHRPLPTVKGSTDTPGTPYFIARCSCGWTWPWACGEDEALRTAWAHVDTMAKEARR